MPNEPLILEETIRRKLDPLMVVASKVRAGAIKGERRSTKRGTSVEFADYRNYAPGDDLRRLDWNVYARLERPYIKLLEDEEDLAVHILLDVSESMNWPPDSDAPANINKLLFGKRLAAGLAYISLGTNDRVILTPLNGNSAEPFGPTRGRRQSVPMLRYVHALKSGGVTDLNSVLKDYALRSNRPGMAFIISDMFSPSGYLDGLNALLARGNEVTFIHLLSPDEITPPIVGDLRLVDVETGVMQEVSVDIDMRGIYMRRVEEWQNEIRAECRRRDVHYVSVQTDMAWEKVLLYDLRRIGVVK